VIEVPQFDHLSCFSYNYFKILTIFQNICLDTEKPFKKLIKSLIKSQGIYKKIVAKYYKQFWYKSQEIYCSKKNNRWLNPPSDKNHKVESNIKTVGEIYHNFFLTINIYFYYFLFFFGQATLVLLTNIIGENNGYIYIILFRK
jgi:hypothetical protein